MIAEQFDPLDVECLIRTAAELWQEAGTAASDSLSEYQKEVLNQALTALAAEHPAAIPQRTVLQAADEPSPVWVLYTWDKNNDVYTMHASEKSAWASLAEYVRTRWEHDALHGDEAPTPPQDDMKAINLFYGPQEDCEEAGYSIFQEKVHA